MRSVVAGLMLLLAGCIRPPEIVLVDRATALEQQASGSFVDLERRLMREAIVARPVPLTPDQLEALGVRNPPLVDATDLTDEDRIDQLLAQHCIGEAIDGTLVETQESCKGSPDRVMLSTLVERVNHARHQLWRWMQGRQPKTALKDLRQAWRKTHLTGVVCGAWVEEGEGRWQEKGC